MSMEVVGDNLFIGQSDGGIYRCNLTSGDECVRVLYYENYRITGKAYDKQGDCLYVTLKAKYFSEEISSKLWRYTLRFKKIRRIYTYDYEHKWNSGLTAVHIDYDAVWAGTNFGIIKCPLIENYASQVHCQEFYSTSTWDSIFNFFSKPVFQNNHVHHIGSKNGYIYSSMTKLSGKLSGSTTEMWKCDPKKPDSCRMEFVLPDHTRSFLILD